MRSPSKALTYCFTNKKPRTTTTSYDSVIGSLCVESGFLILLLGLDLTSFFLFQFIAFMLLYLLLTVSLKESWQPMINSDSKRGEKKQWGRSLARYC